MDKSVPGVERFSEIDAYFRKMRPPIHWDFVSLYNFLLTPFAMTFGSKEAWMAAMISEVDDVYRWPWLDVPEPFQCPPR